MSLRARLNLLLTAMFLLVLGLGTVLVIYNAKRAVEAETQSTARLALQLIEVALAGAPAEAPPDRLLGRLGELEGARHLRVALVEGGREVPLGAGSPGERVADAPAWFVRLVAPAPAEFRRPLPAGVREAEIVVRADPADEIEESWHDARIVLGLVLAFSMIANGLLYVTIGRWLKPVRRIVEGLEGIEKGDYRARLPAFPLPELAHIAAKFNRMAEVLELSREQNRTLTGQALAIREAERRLLAHELHDELGQSISAIRAVAASIEQSDAKAAAGTIAGIASGMQEVVRGITRRLRPVLLDEFGLVAALQDLVDGWNERHPESFCRLSARGRLDELGSEMGIHVYRIVQECLTNASKHAGATAVRVDVHRTEEDGDAVAIAVRDDGVGFDVRTKGQGLGLLGIRERVESLGGHVTIESAPGQGVAVAARIPLSPVAEARA
ncbi:MAG TPA: ATP-binding protein [Gammaproteobacteria bacterium]